MKVIKIILLYCWELPNIILGILYYYWLTFRGINVSEISSDYLNCQFVFCVSNINSSICFGAITFITMEDITNGILLLHERGHYLQSRMSGWFYIPLILIPSIIYHWYYFDFKKNVNPAKYYEFYTERIADYLVGIRR